MDSGRGGRLPSPCHCDHARPPPSYDHAARATRINAITIPAGTALPSPTWKQHKQLDDFLTLACVKCAHALCMTTRTSRSRVCHTRGARGVLLVLLHGSPRMTAARRGRSERAHGAGLGRRRRVACRHAHGHRYRHGHRCACEHGCWLRGRAGQRGQRRWRNNCGRRGGRLIV